MRVAAAILYAAAMLGVVALLDAGSGWAFPIWTAASLCLGWIGRRPWLALLPLLASPIAAPFGYPQEWWGREALPLWFGVLGAALGQAAIVLLAVFGRRLYERSRRS